MVSIDLGAHMDGYAALAGHTLIVGGAAKGRQADCILAAANAFKAITNLMQPGVNNNELTKSIEKVMKQYDCEPLTGVVSYKIRKDLMDGVGGFILNKAIPAHKPKDFELAPGDVFCLDVCASTGKGLPG